MAVASLWLIFGIIWLPIVQASVPVQQPPPTAPIVIDVPPFGTGLNFTNPQIIRDRAGVIWAATRADSSIGGLVWRVDGYQGPEIGRRGTPTQVNPTNPQQFFANGELIVWPDGYLYYVTVQIDNLQSRNPLAQTAWPVPGWTP
jgi:hypothetical protein